MISAMLWSMSSTPAPCSSRTERTAAAKSGTSASGEPGGRLVEQHEARLGRERAGDAEPALVAVCERAGRRVGVAVRPSRSSSSRPARAPRAARRRRRARRPRRSRAPRARGTRGVLERPREPARPRRCAGQRVTFLPSSSTAPCVGRSKPLRTFTSVDLPAPFGPIRPTISRATQLERDLAERLHALEGARHRGGPERCSGPPIGLGLCRGQAVLDMRDDLGDDRADDPRDVVLDLDHAVLPPVHRVQLRARSSRGPDNVGTFLNFSISSASAAPFVEPPPA